MTDPQIKDGDLNKVLGHPTTLGVFIYMQRKSRNVGVREVQRALKISNPSTAYWHLNKLLEENIIIQHSDNSYELKSEYEKINKIPININMNYYLVKGRLFPNLFVLLIFVLMISISLIITISLEMFVFSSIVGIISIMVVIILLIKFLKSMSIPLQS
jgi:hypothetical protein